MQEPTGMPTLNLGANWTPLARTVLGTLFAVYVAQLLSSGRVEAVFAWQPVGAGFWPWQLVTNYLLSGYDPLWTVFQWIVIFFLLAPLDGLLGRRAFLGAIATSWAVSVAITFSLAMLGVVAHTGPIFGLPSLVAAMIAVFGFVMPDARFLFMFVIPIRAAWLAWGTGLLAFLYMLAARDAGSTLGFFAWGGAWAWTGLRHGGIRRLFLRWKRDRIERKLAKFEVIEGGRNGADGKRSRGRDVNDWVN